MSGHRAAILVVALLAGCGGSEPTHSPLYTYPDEVKAAFMDSCVSAASRNRPVERAQSACRCALLRLEDRIPASDLQQIGTPRMSARLAAAVKDAIRNCQ